ncbi:MAG: AtpZ/AtpI family protein [Anaerolineae bacterium]|nr:AtpZ/AtpI family protein [Anaerolineae bacterium]
MIDSSDLNKTSTDEPPNRPANQSLKGLTVLGSGVSGLGCAVPILVIAAIFIGRWLDDQAGTSPWIMLALVIGSVIFGLAVMVSSALSAAKAAQDQYNRNKGYDNRSHNFHGKD